MTTRTHRLLLVEQSATMRFVVDRHAQTLGFIVKACETYEEANACLRDQFQQFGEEFSAVLFGWPTTRQEDAEAFASLLEKQDYKDLPVVVLSSDMRAETLAWAGERDNCDVIAWKEYQLLDNLLEKLVDVVSDDATDSISALTDNKDISLLVVDDSATIRYSLRDLFQMQGFDVALASTHEEAIALASRQHFDIAILDFYLAESTGDTLCQELVSREVTEDIICTVLTGTYSDHIIKRSLRAGALECMFKNESSELLLSRIDALCRLVRQRRALRTEHTLLEAVAGLTAGAMIIISNDNRVVYVNDLALDELGVLDKQTLLEHPADQILEQTLASQPDSQVQSANWKIPPEGAREATTLSVDFQHSRIEPDDFSVLRFTKRKVPIAKQSPDTLQQHNDPESMTSAVIEHYSLHAQSEPFLQQMQHYLEESQTDVPYQVSLLVLEVSTRDENGNVVSIAQQEWLSSLVGEALANIYKRENHFTALTGNRFAYLVRHYDDAQAYTLTRKIMQFCIELTQNSRGERSSESGLDKNRTVSLEDPEIFCNASLLSLAKNGLQPMNVLLQHTFKGLALVRTQAPNQAILLDLRRLLSAYPEAK